MLHFTWIFVILAISGVNCEAPQNNGEVDITEHPYMAIINKNGRPVCTGVIINEYTILTSDRCVPPIKHAWNIMNDMTVVTGTNTLKPDSYRSHVKETFSQNNYFDPTMNPVTSGLGVIKTSRPILFKDKEVEPIKLSSTEVSSGVDLQMVGWMIEDSEGKKSLKLKEVTLTTIDHQECQPFYEKKLTDYEFCTLPKSIGNFFKGDSGSALMYKGELVGLTTFGISRENPVVPDVHTNVFKIHEYIKKFLAI